jgi:hypothetical protein
MPRDAGLANVQALDHIVHLKLATAKRPHDPAAARICKGLEWS